MFYITSQKLPEKRQGQIVYKYYKRLSSILRIQNCQQLIHAQNLELAIEWQNKQVLFVQPTLDLGSEARHQNAKTVKEPLQNHDYLNNDYSSTNFSIGT